MKALLRLLFHPFLLAVLGLIALSLLIWFVGPLIAIAEYRPLESALPRWLLIGLLALIYVARQLWKSWKARATNRQLIDGLVASGRQKQPAAAPTAADQEAATLRARFEEAVGLLRKLRISAAGRKPGFGDLLSLSGRQYLYQLPWYVFIGAPGSGKTTALVNSGLEFPLAEKFGNQALRGVGGTRNCDWWFTDEAILLDTAGRYTTQESDRETDKAAWNSFLQLLKKFRPRRPINGILLTISASDLLAETATEREAHARAVRTRIQELHEQFGIRFPIYVLISKCDLLAGFTEFFGDFGKEERAQVWGMSFPYRGDEDRAPPLADFAREFDALHTRLLDRLLPRLQQERSVERRALIFGFPQQLAALKPVLGQFLGEVFVASKFEESPLLRGVYFTSGTQEGSPIDRVMGQISRAFGLAGRALPAQRSSGRSYFLTRLLRDVVFDEQALAGINLRWERRRTLLRWAAYSAVALLGAGLVVAWCVSYARNRGYVSTVQSQVPEVARQVAALPPIGTADLLAILPALTAARDLALTPEIAEGSTPASMSFGLYQGDKLSAAASLSYRQLLRDAFLPRIARRVEEQLRNAPADDPDYSYEALKAYLMLHDPSHVEPETLKAWITLDWDNTLGRDVSTDQRESLVSSLDALLEFGAPDSPLPLDDGLVASTRSRLANYSVAQRVYNRLRRQGLGTDFPSFSISRAAGPSAALVFERAGRAPLDQGVPGFFSYDAYHSAFAEQVERLPEQLVREAEWVMGRHAGSATDSAGLVTKLTPDVKRLYLEDYARTWEAFVADIRLRRASDLQGSIEIARILSAPDSPLPPLLKAIARETSLGRKLQEDKNLADTAGEKVGKARSELNKLLSTQRAASSTGAARSLESVVDDRFAGIRSLVTAPEGQPPPINQTLQLINQVYVLLNATDTALKGGMTPPPSEVPNTVKAESGRMPEPLRSMLQDLSQASASQALGATRANLSAAVSSNIGSFCREATAGRYPFSRSSQREVTRDDFARLFAPGGLFDDFFQKNLAAMVDTTTRPWSFRKLNEASMGDAGSLVQFQRAATIRDVFFRAGGNTPALKLDFKPVEMDASVTQFVLNMDGQLVRYNHGPQMSTALQWPSPQGGDHISVQMDPPSAGGTSSLSADGPWALFRLFDKVAIEPGGQPERFRATFDIEGRKAQFEVTASSVQNPFRLRELQEFQCPAEL